MSSPQKQENQAPPGYPSQTPATTTGKRRWPATKTKGDRGFIEGCLFALCCCWICEECCI